MLCVCVCTRPTWSLSVCRSENLLLWGRITNESVPHWFEPNSFSAPPSQYLGIAAPPNPGLQAMTLVFLHFWQIMVT